MLSSTALQSHVFRKFKSNNTSICPRKQTERQLQWNSSSATVQMKYFLSHDLYVSPISLLSQISSLFLFALFSGVLVKLQKKTNNMIKLRGYLWEPTHTCKRYFIMQILLWVLRFSIAHMTICSVCNCSEIT